MHIKSASNLFDFSSRAFEAIFGTVRTLVKSCQRRAPDALDVLLPEKDELVTSELMDRIQKGHGHLDPEQKWFAGHQKEYSKYRVSWGCESPCPATRTSPWLKTLTPLQRSTLVLHQKKLLMGQPKQSRTSMAAPCTASGQNKRTMIKKLMVDIHPSIGRMNTSSFDEQQEHQAAPCILPHQCLWLHLPEGREARPMIGRESMMFQGWPVSKVPPATFMTDRNMQDLAGNGVSLPVLLALVMSACMSLTWVVDKAAEEPKDEEGAEEEPPVLTEVAAAEESQLPPLVTQVAHAEQEQQPPVLTDLKNILGLLDILKT